jgi:hypothetical protein
MKFLRELFSDDNTINEKSVVGFGSFIMMVITLTVDIVTGVMGYKMPIHEFVFDGFLLITLGSFGIASVDKWVNNKGGKKNEDDVIDG